VGRRGRKETTTGVSSGSEDIQPQYEKVERATNGITRNLKKELVTTNEILEEQSGSSEGLRAEFSMKEIRKLNGNFGRFYSDVERSGEWAKMKPGEKAVYIYLCTHADNVTGRVFHKIKKIAEGAGISKRKVSESLDKLVERKLIQTWTVKTVKRGGFVSFRHIRVLHIAYVDYRLPRKV